MKILNYIKINKQIATAGQPTKEEFKLLTKKGFEVLVNLAMHNKGALKKEDKIVSKLGMIYIHIPVTWKVPEVDRLHLFLKILESLEKENRKVFIHCIKNYIASALCISIKSMYGKKVQNLSLQLSISQIKLGKRF